MPDENIPEEQSDEELLGNTEGEGTSEPSQPEEGSTTLNNQPEYPTETQTPQEVEIDGQKYSVDDIKDAIKAREDYNYLLPDYTRKSQKLAELQKQLEQVKQSSAPEDQKLEEAKRILKDQMGVVTREDLEQLKQSFAEEADAKIQLQEAVGALSQKYSGAHGEPKFDYSTLQQYLYNKYGLDRKNYPPVVDLEYEYWKMNEDYYSKLPEAKSAVANVERGSNTPYTIPKRKITFEPKNKDEVSVEDAAREMLKNIS